MSRSIVITTLDMVIGSIFGVSITLLVLLAIAKLFGPIIIY